MQRIFGYVYKYLSPKLRGQSDILTPSDIKAGTLLLIKKNIRLIHLNGEYKALTSKKNVSQSSKMSTLMPIIDDSGLIRVGGRLQHSSLCYDAEPHIILPKNRTFPVSLVMHFHRKQLHAGHHCLLASIRQQYWTIGGHIYIAS